MVLVVVGGLPGEMDDNRPSFARMAFCGRSGLGTRASGRGA